MQFSIKKFLPHILVVFGFVVVALAYFSPVLQGKKIFQSDIKQYIGMAKQQNDFRETTGEETYWTNSAFGGMPTYQLGAQYPFDFLTPIHKIFQLLPHPTFLVFLYLLGCYFFLLAMRVPMKYAVFGALAYAPTR